MGREGGCYLVKELEIFTELLWVFRKEIILIKKIKINLGINLITDVQDFDTENDKRLLREIKDLNKWK